MEGDRGRTRRAGDLEQLLDPALGAVRHRQRPERVPRPGRAAAGEGAGSRCALVGRSRPLRRVRVAPFPRPWEWGLDPEAAADLALRGLDELHRHELAPEETACYLVE